MADTVSIRSEVEFEAEGSLLKGILGHPRDACGLVLFAHGTGSGRHSKHNHVRAPTLLIVGGDTNVIELNRAAMHQMVAEHDLQIVPNASHLFAEPGTLQAAALLARDWFRAHLCGNGTQA